MKPDRLDEVPIRECNGRSYVDLAEIPELARSAFRRSLYGAQCPLIPGVKNAAYSWDWTLFLERYRRAN